ncbi:Predicted membrane protein [Lentzea albidocapillata subsp. violacea]|uniref:Predicted membrane protein n=1 Tax=Lentzea albidocapillata subsp. violacea TaxID=128104 RepID=A0A1G9ZAG3_9PSEU|nr:Predicted membrane protein [Lentzea albidocapillata subsp. violacea]
MLGLLPVSCWVVSLVLDFASRSAADPVPDVRAATSLIGWGLLAAGAAAVAGFVDSLPIPARTKAFRMALVHFGLMTAASITFLTSYVLRKAEPLDQPVGVQALAVSLIGAVFLLAGVVSGALLAHRRV